MRHQLHAGTSGFAYKSWKPAFYPKEVPDKRFLEYYSGRLNSVEVNFSFRRIMPAATLDNWVAQTPAGFLFAPKAHQKITHILRLQNAHEFLQLFIHSLAPLKAAGKLGPILFQTPPNLKCDSARLANFLSDLQSGLQYAFEFRHESWLNAEVYGMLERHGACLCLAESDKLAIPDVLTAPFVYLRLRKAEYAPEERAQIAAKVRELLAERDVFLYYKHEDTPDGALYAEELLKEFGAGGD